MYVRVKRYYRLNYTGESLSISRNMSTRVNTKYTGGLTLNVREG